MAGIYQWVQLMTRQGHLKKRKREVYCIYGFTVFALALLRRNNAKFQATINEDGEFV